MGKRRDGDDGLPLDPNQRRAIVKALKELADKPGREISKAPLAWLPLINAYGSKKGLYEFLGVTHSTLNNWCMGKTPAPKISQLAIEYAAFKAGVPSPYAFDAEAQKPREEPKGCEKCSPFRAGWRPPSGDEIRNWIRVNGPLDVPGLIPCECPAGSSQP